MCTLKWAICTLTWAGKRAQSVSPCQQCPPTYSPTPACAPLVRTPFNIHNVSSYICEGGRYAVFTSPKKSLRPQPVSPERDRARRRRRRRRRGTKEEVLASCSARTPHQFAPRDHICQHLPLATTRATQRWGQFAPANTLASAPCTTMRIVSTPGFRASSSASSTTSRRRCSTRDTCASCCSKSHDESFTYCQSLKSDNSTHLLCIFY